MSLRGRNFLTSAIEVHPINSTSLHPMSTTFNLPLSKPSFQGQGAHREGSLPPMGIRTIKPEFFLHEALFELED